MFRLLSLRLVLGIFGSFLAIVALWLVLPGLTASDIEGLPKDQTAATVAAAQRGEARWMAWLGLLRGDLWSQAAFANAELIWVDPRRVPAALILQAKDNVAHAVALAPVNGGLWLLLTQFALHYGWQVPNPVETLKMSYYTGPHDDAIIPQRLAAAARLDVSADSEAERLFRSELENILTTKPELRTAVRAAYAVATPSARKIISNTASLIDPAFATGLGSAHAQ